MNRQVFREYDIRGIVEKDFTDDFIMDLGRAYATILHRAGKKKITLGRDCRLSSPRLRNLMLEGLLPAGIDVIDVGVVPTPLLYFSVLHWKMDGGVMITGSHSAAEYNGFKLGVGPTTIFGEDIQKVADIVEMRDFETKAAKGILSEVAILPEYSDFIRANIMIRPGLKVAIDGGTGCGGGGAEPLMQEAGGNIHRLCIQMCWGVF